MSYSNVIDEKTKALLAYKKKILHEIKHTEKTIDDFRANLKKNKFYEDHAVSSESEDDFPSTNELGPSLTQLKQLQAMKKTCLHATQELTGLLVLQSEVDVLVEEPKFERERPVTEAGTWREVTVECRIDLVPFSMTFFMHTPDRKFGPKSYRGLRVVPVKSSHELELSKSVLHSLKVPSDAVEVLRSYAAGYRSRRTTLARLANKYTNVLFMEPHSEGGFIMKCADLLEVSWKLENKWSPVAPFHHKMKFDLEFMEESFIKIITQAHKELLDPALQTDERTLLLAKIITTCLEARGPIDPESDLESKTTERDNDIDRRDSESEKRDSEVMAPPKSLPKKGKQKKAASLPNTAEKRKIDEDNSDAGAKKMRNDLSEAKKSLTDNNPRKSKINDVVSEGGKKRKISEPNKVVSSKIVKEIGNIEDCNTISNEDKTSKTKNVKETNKNAKNQKENVDNIAVNPMNIKESGAKAKNATETDNNAKNHEDNIADKPKNIKESGIKSKNVRETDKNPKNAKQNEDNNADKPKNIKESRDKAKSVKETVKNAKNAKENDADKPKNMKEPAANKDKNTNIKTKDKVSKEAADTVSKQTNTKTKTKVSKEAGDTASKDTNPKAKVLKEPAKLDSNSKSKTKIVKDTDKLKDVNTNDTVQNKESATKKAVKVPSNTEKLKNNVNKAKNIITKEADNDEDNKNDKKESTTKKAAKEPSNTQKVKNDVNKAKNIITKDTDSVEDKNDNKKDNITKKKVKNVANVKSKENININNDAGHPISKFAGKNSNDEKNLPTNANKIDPKPKNTDTTKVKNVANAESNDQTSKKGPEKNTKVASAKNDGQSKKVSDKNKEKLTEVANKGAQKNIIEKTVSNNDKNDPQKVIEKNATNVRLKDKISQISNKLSEKNVKEKLAHIQNKPEKVLSNNLNTKTKNIIKKPLITKIASHRNSLKPQNPPKVLKAGLIKSQTTGNIEKENGGKGSKIPQKTLSIISEGSSKKNFLRISPRIVSSKFKTQPQQTLKQKMIKYTNIPRLLKKPAPKTT